MAIKIVTDSSITIEPKIVDDLDITIVPLSVMIDGVLYSDADLELDEFMEKMATAKNLPKTSQPPVGVFAEVYDKLSEEADEVISIHMTDILSGTVEAARQGSILSGKNVTVIDSDFTDQALKFQVVQAAKMAKDGASKDEILAAIKKTRENTELYIGFSTLENMVKGGRVSRMTGLFGALLNVKVIGTLKDHELGTLIRGRGNKTFNRWLEDLAASISSSGRAIKEIGISHVESLEFAQNAKDTLQKFVEKPIAVLDTNSTIATHTGPGAWAIMISYE
ncbi:MULTISPECIES: DegV family protein [unclassified Lactococcus]|uniref:DegV family protein n=1 Tax=unclassified Lactococcus TaxID=2643510 RepID=UPI0011CC3177|nr:MULTISPECIES: DegV family protein [unclassified Lactococcus]MQW22076.1 DegV family EDD domain-containing protein [Lactococcus sp. dk101]TXK45018.1 DegV family protein [Lactococcus sp. dk310]TXK51201.1 DegV family protein [Lactococcus sp. dk322]